MQVACIHAGSSASLDFGILLIHRDLRDGEACEKKYGKDWDKYCSIVKYRLIPFIY